MRRRGRTDEIQAECVKQLRAIGATVQPLSNAGNGVPDLLIGYRGVTLLAECKGPESLKRHKKTNGRTPAQVDWHESWGGEAPIMATSAEQLREAVEARAP